MFPDRLDVAEWVVLLKQAVEQRLFCGASHGAELERPDLGQTAAQRRGVHLHQGRSFAFHQRVRHGPPNGRQFDHSGPVQVQHQPAAHHGAQSSIRLPPVPRLAQQPGKGFSTGLGMFGNELANESDIGIGDHALPVAPYGLHLEKSSRSVSGT